MPAWLVKFLVEQLSKLLTPDLVEKIETAAKQFVCCQLKSFAASTETEIDDALVQKVADALGVDLSKCAA